MSKHGEDRKHIDYFTDYWTPNKIFILNETGLGTKKPEGGVDSAMQLLLASFKYKHIQKNFDFEICFSREETPITEFHYLKNA